MAAIQIRSVSKVYSGGGRPAVDRVSLEVADGELLVLLGPSGCGKTTLLRMVAGLEQPDSGRIMIGGQDSTDLPPRRRMIAMVFQSYAVFPHLTVFENIAFGLRMRREAQTEVARKVARAAAMLDLTPYLARYPAQLSGGQRQRVAVARAIVMEPQVLLMDEPLSNLDALLRLQFRAELKTLVQKVRATTIYVTHDQIEAMSLGDRIAVMRDGAVVQCAAPMQVYDRPASSFVGGFIGNPPMNFLRGHTEAGPGVRVVLGNCALDAPPELPVGQEVLLGIRAEHIEPLDRPAPDALAANAEVVEPIGPHLLVTALVAGQRLKLLTHIDFPVRAGAPLWLRPEPARLRWFDPQTGQSLGAT